MRMLLRALTLGTRVIALSTTLFCAAAVFLLSWWLRGIEV